MRPRPTDAKGSRAQLAPIMATHVRSRRPHKAAGASPAGRVVLSFSPSLVELIAGSLLGWTGTTPGQRDKHRRRPTALSSLSLLVTHYFSATIARRVPDACKLNTFGAFVPPKPPAVQHRLSASVVGFFGSHVWLSVPWAPPFCAAASRSLLFLRSLILQTRRLWAARCPCIRERVGGLRSSQLRGA